MQELKESQLVNLVALVHFVFVVDFMMVAPLGPDYTIALGAENSSIGIVVASYTFAAAIAGLLFAKLLDKFDRRNVMVFFLIALSLSTILCAFSRDISELILFRFIAGFFGGPAATIGIAIIIDTVPEKRRGQAIGKVMSSFSFASIIGIPIGLMLSQYGGWDAPFYVVGILIFITALLVLKLLPPMIQHLAHNKIQNSKNFLTLFYRREALVTYFMTITGMLAAFLIIPNIAAFMQFNLAYPRESYGTLYFFGGLIGLLAMRLTGKYVDMFDIKTVGYVATLLIIFITYAWFIATPVLIPSMILFAAYMAAMSMRNVVAVSTSSMVPNNHERAAFTSLNQSISHFAAGVGSLLGAHYLTVEENGNLVGMTELGIVAIILSMAMPFCLIYLYNFIQSRKTI